MAEPELEHDGPGNFASLSSEESEGPKSRQQIQRITHGQIDITVNALGHLLNVTPRRVQQLAAAGALPRGRNGHYDLAGSLAAFGRQIAQGLESENAYRRRAAMDSLNKFARLTTPIEKQGE